MNDLLRLDRGCDSVRWAIQCRKYIEDKHPPMEITRSELSRHLALGIYNFFFFAFYSKHRRHRSITLDLSYHGKGHVPYSHMITVSGYRLTAWPVRAPLGSSSPRVLFSSALSPICFWWTSGVGIGPPILTCVVFARNIDIPPIPVDSFIGPPFQQRAECIGVSQGMRPPLNHLNRIVPGPVSMEIPLR